MADLDFKTPEQIAEEYLTELKALKPDVNRDQKDSDWWIRSRVVGGTVSGVYADQRLIANDAFPQRARRDAVGRALETYLNDSFKSPTNAEGFAAVFGTPGTPFPALSQMTYGPNGNVYQTTADVEMGASGDALAPVESVSTGQDQNLLSGAELTISSPPAGIDATASASGDISSGRDEESTAEGASRVLDFIREPISGGTSSDYRQWARNADDAVVEASTIRFHKGLGTVGIVITAGTTDIDKALDEGAPVVLTPSGALIQIVQDYIDARKPDTDCAEVLSPELLEVDVSVRVRFAQGGLTTVLAGQTLTQGELVQREVKRAIYKTPPGGRRFGNQGYVVASEIEEVIDQGLSSSPYSVGVIEMLVDRQVDDLSATGTNLAIGPTQVPIPGSINVTEF